jgi:hypothetical protein
VNEISDTDERISPAAIPHCEVCGVKNFAVGGRTPDGRFHPLYVADDAAHTPIAPKIGKRGWCGAGAPGHFLTLVRIICRPIALPGTAGDEKLNLCPRCAHIVVAQQARDDERETDERVA